MPSVTASLVSIAPATPRSRLLTVDLGGRPYSFRAGQAILLGTRPGNDRRPYSIACSPERVAETGRLELLVAIDGTSDLGWAVPGADVAIDGPFGTFTFPEPPEHQWLLFVAGGTGIAPLRAMIDHALRRHPSHQVSVLYSARRSDEFAFIDELRDHERAGRIELHQTVTRDDSETWQGRRGRIGRSEFVAVLHRPAATLCFVCGPPAMVSESVTTLRQLEVPETLIRTEQWGDEGRT